MKLKNKVIGIFHRFFPSNKKIEFSIGIYHGDNPLNLQPYKNNPVLTKEDVHDREAAYIADPFMIKKDNLWYMFFEIKILNSFRTELAYATSEDGFNWEYQKALDMKPLFRSYPYVFQYENKMYIVPETAPLKSIVLYSAENFPEEWKQEYIITEGRDYVDPSIFRHKDKWWLFTSTTDNENLYLFYSDNLTCNWKEHPSNPIIKKDSSKARLGGRVIEYNGDLYRMGQDCKNSYGERVRAFKIKKLTETEYAEEESSTVIEKTNEGWNSQGMHTFDAHKIGNKWIAVVDGYKEYTPSKK